MHKGRRRGTVALVGAVGSVVWLSAGAPPAVTTSLPMSKHEGVRLDDARADGILAEATRLLRTADTQSDMICDLTLKRENPLQTFDIPDIIDSSTDFAVACQRPGRVHVVEHVFWCGGECSTCMGCSQQPGSCMVVSRQDEALEGILWAHEYGHNVGNGDLTSPGNVMHFAVLSGNFAVTTAQCGLFLSPATKGQSGGTAQPAMSLDEFVRTPFIHGVPYDQASRFTGDDVPRLLQMLQEPPPGVRLSNVVLTLGMIGDSRADQALRTFASAGPEDTAVSREVFVAKRSAVVALGYLYFRTRERSILTFLTEGLQQDFWASRVNWRASNDAISVSRALSLASVQALGVTGDPLAAVMLEQAKGDAEFAAVVADAQRQNARVLQSGPAAFSASPP